MSRLSEAAVYPVFSNGTEGEAWMRCWCYANCVHEEGCDLILDMLLHNSESGHPLPEGLLPEPDDGKFALPSRMVCLKYAASDEGDPGADERPERVAAVLDYWRAAIDAAPVDEIATTATGHQWPDSAGSADA